MHEAQRKKPPSVERLDAAAVLRSPRIAFCVGATRRREVEKELGVAFSYPARGWHTYATREDGTRCFLSAFYKDGVLIAVELYVPSAEHAPPLTPGEFGGFTLEPCNVRIGMDAGCALEGSFDGGVVYAKARERTIDRIAIYAGTAPA